MSPDIIDTRKEDNLVLLLEVHLRFKKPACFIQPAANGRADQRGNIPHTEKPDTCSGNAYDS